MNRGRGALLLGALVSLAILVTVSMAISAVVRDSVDRLGGSADHAVAADYARSALSQIEAGIATPESLSGPVPVWDASEAIEDAGDAYGPVSSDQIEPGGGSAEPSGWMLEIETQPSPYDGLTLVSVTALLEAEPGVRATLHQLVRFSDSGEDSVGELDEITEEAFRSSSGGGRP